MNIPLRQTGLAYRGIIILVLASGSFNGIAGVALASATPAIAQHFTAGGQGIFLAQLILVAPALSIILGSPLANMLGRLIGPRRLLLGALALYVLAGLFPLFTPDFVPVIISRLVLGGASSLISTLALAQAGGMPHETRYKLIGFGTALASLASITSIIAAGWLAGKFGWQAACLVYIWPLPLLPAFFAMPAAAPGPVQTQVKEGMAPYLTVAPLFLLTILWSAVMFAPSIAGPFLLAARGMDNPAIIGLVMGGTGLIAAGASALYGWVARLLDFNGQILLVFTLFFIAAVIIVLASTVGLTEAGLVFTGMASGLIAPSLVTMIIHRVEVRHIATAMGLFTSMIYTSQLLDPFLFQGMKAVLRLSPFTAIMLICAGGIAASLPRAIRTAVR